MFVCGYSALKYHLLGTIVIIVGFLKSLVFLSWITMAMIHIPMYFVVFDDWKDDFSGIMLDKDNWYNGIYRIYNGNNEIIEEIEF